MLLDEDCNLKVTDFGLSTVFMHKGQRRLLTTMCGTPPYVAPEVRVSSLGYYPPRCLLTERTTWLCG
jgi:serine/threonine-protein kinase Chk1